MVGAHRAGLRYTPINGDYPTSYWEPGEYRLAVVLYRPADGTRLPVWDTAGAPQPEDRVILPAVIELPTQN